MRIPMLRPDAAIAAVALAVMATALACGSPPAQPLSAQPPSTASPNVQPSQDLPPKGAGTHAADPVPKPQTTKPRRCLGAVTHTIDTRTDRRWPTLCIAVGGVVQAIMVGPDGMSESPHNMVSCFYEGGSHVCRLIATGTVRFKVTDRQQTRTLTVVVVKTASPPGPSPACDGARTRSVSWGGPPPNAQCIERRTLLRLENQDLDGFSASPSSHVSCTYAAGVRECRFVKTGTVRFTLTSPGAEPVELIVVVIK